MLNIENLRVDLDTDDAVIRAVDAMWLSIERGETFALVGESGCGKSMTALALMRLLPENGRVTNGRLLVGDEDILDLPETQMRSVRGGRIGMIFQEPSTSLNPVMRVGDQIVEAIQAHTALRGAAARSKAIDWLRRVGIPEPERRIDDYPFRMSGGQKQRVMIAMTLAAEPDYLIADEPTTALDVTIQAQILDLMVELKDRLGMAIMLITHAMGVVAETAQRVVVMYAGKVVEEASVEDLFARPRHPYTQGLIRSIPRIDTAATHKVRLEAIGGTVPKLINPAEGCRFADRCKHAMPACRTATPALVEAKPGHKVACILEAALS